MRRERPVFDEVIGRLKHELRALRGPLKAIAEYLPHFIRNPVLAIRHLPRWDWMTSLLFFGSAAAVSGTLNGLVRSSFWEILLGLTLFPLTSTLLAFIVAGVIYYSLLFAFNREVEIGRIFILVTLSAVPTLVMNILGAVVSPAILIGVGASGLLLHVGGVENFQIPRRVSARLILVLFGIAVLSWIILTVQRTADFTETKRLKMPQDLDQMEREIRR